MSGAETENAVLAETERNLIAQIEEVLEHRKRLIDQEVNSYPRPITACDVQFEHALDEQARIRRELTRARALFDCAGEREALARAVGEFVASCTYITADSERQINTLLANLIADRV